MKLLGFGVFMTALMKTIIKVFQIVILVTLNLAVYFGLWIPIVYMIICGILMLTGGLDLTIMDTNTILFYCGLALCLAGSVVISIRHLLIIPIKEMINVSDAKNKIKDKQELDKKRKLYIANPAKYFIKYEGEMPHDSHPVYLQSKKERENTPPPLIYRSNVDTSIVIHEYSNHYEIYREVNGNCERIDIKEKPREDESKKKKKKSQPKQKKNKNKNINNSKAQNEERPREDYDERFNNY